MNVIPFIIHLLSSFRRPFPTHLLVEIRNSRYCRTLWPTFPCTEISRPFRQSRHGVGCQERGYEVMGLRMMERRTVEGAIKSHGRVKMKNSRCRLGQLQTCGEWSCQFPSSPIIEVGRRRRGRWAANFKDGSWHREEALASWKTKGERMLG